MLTLFYPDIGMDFESIDSNVIDNETNDNEENDNNLPVGATHDQNFIRELENLGPRRDRRPPIRLIEEDNDENDGCFVADILTADIDEPSNIQDAWNGKHSSQWKEATDAEFASLITNETRDLVPLPKGKNVVGS